MRGSRNSRSAHIAPIVDRSLSSEKEKFARKHSRHRILAPVVVSVILLVACTALVGLPKKEGRVPPSELISRITYLAHDPIAIIGNDGFTNDSGVVTGSGTESDPYIIEGWDINASSVIGIAIQNTSSHFVLRSCYVHDGLSNLNCGIHILNCTNCTVDRNNCSRNAFGICLEASNGNVVLNNSCSGSVYVSGGIVFGEGVSLISSNNNLLEDNACHGNHCAVRLVDSDHNAVIDNDLAGSILGVWLTSSSGNCILSNDGLQINLNQSNNNTVDRNVCSGGMHLAMSVHSSNGNIISNNFCDGGLWGILVEESSSNTLTNNSCGGAEAIELRRSCDNVLKGNNCSGRYTSYGIYIQDSSNNNTLDSNICICSNESIGIAQISSSHNTFINNNCSLNMWGIGIFDSSNNTLLWNKLFGNAEYGLYLGSSFNNLISNNTFVGNNGTTDIYSPFHIQAYDDGAFNRWNGTDGHGNFWSDWTAPDADRDGIVDLPYAISGNAGAEDCYPQTTPQTQIPEFSLMPYVVMALLAIVLLIRDARRTQGS